jgi:adenylate kinase
MLRQRNGWPHLSSGDILRAEVKAGSTLGRKAGSFMEAGKLVPDELIVDLMVDRVTRPDCGNGFILDGFPRTAAQAEALDKALTGRNAPLDAVVYFTCDDAEVLRRITGRRSCPQCNAIYHVQTLPPKADNVCDKCQAALVQRKDDSEAVVAERLAAYRRQTEPLIEYYRSRGLLRQVDGTQSIEATDRAVTGLLNASPAKGSEGSEGSQGNSCCRCKKA